MKNIIQYFRNKSNSMISFLLSILGFGAATGLNSCDITPACEYGTPHATFKVLGNVKAEANSENISNIRVVMQYDTAYTDESGNYQVEMTEFPSNQNFLIEFNDVDGAENGTFQALDTTVSFIDPEFTGGEDGWYDGETEQELNIELKNEE